MSLPPWYPFAAGNPYGRGATLDDGAHPRLRPAAKHMLPSRRLPLALPNLKLYRHDIAHRYTLGALHTGANGHEVAAILGE
jgi:hypothetical protein